MAMNFKNFDWRSLQKYFSAKSAGDFNSFLEKLPSMAGQTALIAAAIAWTSGAGIGLFATVQAKHLTELRAELKQTEALKPMVPTVRDVPVPQAEIKKFADTLAEAYPDLSIKQQGASITVTATTTANFGPFREAIGHVQNGGTGWRVNLDKLCVGRECDREKLAVLLKINKVSVEKPK